jgi:hypothetical protein
MESPTIRFHNQARIPPKEVRLESRALYPEIHVDLGLRKLRFDAHAEEQALQLASRALRVWMQLIHEHPEASNPPATAIAPNQLPQGGDVEDSEHFRLADRPPQLANRENPRKVKQGPLNGRAWDAVDECAIGVAKRSVSVRLDTDGTSPTTTGSGDINPAPLISLHVPQISS